MMEANPRAGNESLSRPTSTTGVVADQLQEEQKEQKISDKRGSMSRSVGYRTGMLHIWFVRNNRVGDRKLMAFRRQRRKVFWCR